MDAKPVFYDPKGRRGTFVTRFGAIVASIVAVLTTIVLLIAAFTIPYLPDVQARTRATSLPGMPTKDLGRANFLTASYRRQLAAEIAGNIRRSRTEPPIKGPKVVAAFYAPWEASGLASFRKHASAMTHVLPQWLHLSADGKEVDYSRDFDTAANPSNRDVIQIARQNRLSILPILDNQGAGSFDPARTARLLADVPAQKVLALLLANFLVGRDFQGVNIDFELLNGSQSEQFVRFLEILRREFDKHGLTLTVDLEADSSMPIQRVAGPL